MRFFTRFLFALILGCCTFYASHAQSVNGGRQTILVKVQSRQWVETVQKSLQKFKGATVTNASLLQDDTEMRKWLAISFTNGRDSLPIIASLKELRFISCIQNMPRQLLAGVNKEQTQGVQAANDSLPWYIQHVKLPYLWALPKKRNIKIAVVDDGVRITHKDLASHIWVNPGEIANNNKDDDGDGFIDDVHGWDVSDGDNDVAPPADRLNDFYHGTHIAGEIALATPRMPGDKFTIDIIPVKCLSDNAGFLYLKDGYKGIEYAIKAGANIINCSWGGGPFSTYEKDLLRVAAEKNILIIASAGNYPTEVEQYPAAAKGVIAVTGLDSNNLKPHDFNYGGFISLCAPGVGIEGAYAGDDSSRRMLSGTSFATPIVTAAAALLMSAYPNLTAKDVEVLLKNGAIPVDNLNAPIAGKLGAGLVNAYNAVKQLTATAPKNNDTITHAKGYLVYKNAAGLAKHIWFIKPYGHFSGIRLFMPPSYTGSKGEIAMYKNVISDANRLAQYSLQQLPDSFFAAEDSLWIVLQPQRLEKGFSLTIPYTVQTVDSNCLYCTGTKLLNAAQGVFEDGSGQNNYAGRQDCKWLIEAPPGKKITLEFTAFDTEPKVDFVYVFDGESTSGRILAMYSGPNIPPPVTSTGNKLLVWFVTSETVHGKGWQAKYGVK